MFVGNSFNVRTEYRKHKNLRKLQGSFVIRSETNNELNKKLILDKVAQVNIQSGQDIDIKLGTKNNN